ncbi:hypothetical protein HW555_012382, partial [Spodoptera exigua]
ESPCTGPNEYFACDGVCQRSCAALGVACPIPHVNCTDRCYCNPGFARNATGTCIPISQCGFPRPAKRQASPGAAPPVSTQVGQRPLSGPVPTVPSACCSNMSSDTERLAAHRYTRPRRAFELTDFRWIVTGGIRPLQATSDATVPMA